LSKVFLKLIIVLIIGLALLQGPPKAFADGISYVMAPHYAIGSLSLLVTLFVLSVIIYSIGKFRVELLPTVVRKYVPLSLFLAFLVCVFSLDWGSFTPKEVLSSTTANSPIFKFVLPCTYSSLMTGAVALWITAFVDGLSMIHFIMGLASTLLIETLILYFGLGKAHDVGSKILIACLLSLTTYPIVNLLIPVLLNPKTVPAYYWVAETFAVVSECLLFVLVFSKKHSSIVHLTISCSIILLANVASFVYGYLFL
jgi:hypothetical protein